MTFSHFFYQLFIGPLELLMEVTYVFVNKYLYNSGLAIIALSMIINTLLLPMHKRADAIQDEERELEKNLSFWVSHIKKSFHGDERTMMLQTYYRQNNYKPYYALKASLPLILIIPFFIAAFHFLSNLQELHGMSFGPIADLSASDRLITISGASINVLPIAMTLINIISSALYSKGFTLKEKIQLYGMAFIFFILLYNSPSGLVIYWTTNNLFSLGKNLFKKLKKPKQIITFIFFIAGIIIIVFGAFFFHSYKPLFKILLILFGVALELPIIYRLLRKTIKIASFPKIEKSDGKLFLSGCLFLAVLTGALIPSAVIVSSPAEFVLVNNFYSPVRHIVNASLLSFGLFVVWLGVFYYLSNEKIRKVFCLAVWIFSGIAVVDYMFFGTSLGTLSEDLNFINGMYFSKSEILSNLLTVIIVTALLLIALYFDKNRIAKTVLAVLLISITGMSVVNIFKIQRSIPEIRRAVEISSGEKAKIKLNKNGKNIIVFMLDRAINSYIPYLFQENSELEKQFEGFTYYPNTLSYGTSTNFAAPSLFGGYEYTPEELNKRSDEKMVEKHNESLKVMPVLFDEADFEVTVCDPVYAGYGWIPDLSIYDDYPNIHAYVTEHGQFSLFPHDEQVLKSNHIWERNFFCYSIMKISPLIIQKPLYYSGTYLQANSFHQISQTIYTLSKASGFYNRFINSYSVLNSLPQITEVSDESNDTFLLIDNSTTHEATMLAEPEYEPKDVIDNTEYDSENAQRFIYNGRELKVNNYTQMTHYQVNMAALKQVGKWLDYLRENEVFDNTRIILVADHGFHLGSFDDMKFGNKSYEDIMAFNPLLMVKDFNSKEFSVSYDFMTSADTPLLAMSDLIQNPVNPFTGNSINNDAKYEPEHHLFYSTDWQPMFNNGNTFKPGQWYSFHGYNIFDRNSWEFIGEY